MGSRLTGSPAFETVLWVTSSLGDETMGKGYVKEDDMGFYVVWGEYETRRETLRTRNKNKAEAWKIAGNCHGASDHDKTCHFCQSKVAATLAGAG